MSEIKIVHIKSASEFEKEINCSIPVIVDFKADWCGPCKVLWPILEKRFNLCQSFKLLSVNVDDNEETSEKYNVEALPTVLLFKNGKVVDSFVGASEKEVDRLVALTK